MSTTTLAILAIIMALAVGVGVYIVVKQSATPQAVASPTPVGPDVGWQAAGVIGQSVAATVGAVVAAFV